MKHLEVINFLYHFYNKGLKKGKKRFQMAEKTPAYLRGH